MRVLFASGIDGFCHRYAVLHWAEQLATQDVASTVRAHTDPRLAWDLATHDVLVLYRVPDGAFVRHILAQARTLGRPAVFAVDDLIVDPALTDPPPIRGRDADERRLWHDGVARYRRTLEACDAFLATSAPLQATGDAAGTRSYLHRAGLSAREIALGAAARGTSAPRERAVGVRLGYFSGTATHDADLATIAPALRAVLQRHPTARLVVVGPVALAPVLDDCAAQIERAPLVAWPELPARIAEVDVNLAPLVWRDPFVAAKGAVKYLEAAAVGVPTVASPTDAYRDAIRDGETGLLASDVAEWEVALAALIADAARRRRLGDAARADVALRFSPAAQGAALHAILADVVAQHRPAAVPAAPPPTEPPRLADEVALARRFPGEVARAAREPDALPDVARPATTVTAPLGDGVVLAQSFRVGRSGLTRVDVHTVTYGQALDHVLEVRLRRTDGSVAGETVLPAALAPNQDWLALELAPDAGSAAREYVLELRAHGTGAGNALSFGATRASSRDGYVLAGTSADDALALRTFAADA